jgi:xanthine dehydrogenase accessory factor
LLYDALMLIDPQKLHPGPTDADWPMFGLVDDIRSALAALMARGQTGALATLVGVDGPSPRPLGSQMLIDANGAAVGYVSGGCVEGSIAVLAQEVIATGTPQHFIFGADSPFMDIQLICGTRIEVVIEPVRPDDKAIKDLLVAYQNRAPFERETAPDQAGNAYLCRYRPASRLVIFGQDPVAMATAHLAGAMGLEVVFVRDKGPMAPPPGFVGTYLAQAATSAFDAVKLDAWTALVTTTHDLDQDHAVLVQGLVSTCFYVGALGSKKRLNDRLAKLLAAGLSTANIDRLRAPVGLSIGAATPYEIAVSILADVIATRRLAHP